MYIFKNILNQEILRLTKISRMFYSIKINSILINKMNIPDYDLEVNPFLIDTKCNAPLNSSLINKVDYDLNINSLIKDIPDYDLEVNPFLIDKTN